jgi:hypothetical protein
MKKSLITLALFVSFFGTSSAALAYSLPGPVTVSSTHELGTGEVDFTRAAVVEGTFSVDRISGEEVYLTAGDVANGASGFGFLFKDEKVYAVSATGGTFTIARRMPIGFIWPGQSITVRAVFTPNDGIRLDTYSVSSVFKQYSRGIIMDSLPSIRFAPAFSAKAQGATLSVGSWSYTQ